MISKFQCVYMNRNLLTWTGRTLTRTEINYTPTSTKLTRADHTHITTVKTVLAIHTQATVLAVLYEDLSPRTRHVVQPNRSGPRPKLLAPHQSFKGPREAKGTTHDSGLSHGPVGTTDCSSYVVVVNIHSPIGGVHGESYWIGIGWDLCRESGTQNEWQREREGGREGGGEGGGRERERERERERKLGECLQAEVYWEPYPEAGHAPLLDEHTHLCIWRQRPAGVCRWMSLPSCYGNMCGCSAPCLGTSHYLAKSKCGRRCSEILLAYKITCCTHTCTCTHMYMNTYTYMNMNTYLHVHVHTQSNVCRVSIQQ